MSPWEEAFDRKCHELVERVCDVRAPPTLRNASWQALLVKTAPYMETWIRASQVLRRCGLASEDEVRTILVLVLGRMSAGKFANLRAYLANQSPSTADDEDESRIVEDVVRFLGSDELEKGANHGKSVTPLQGWLRTLVRYAVKDHVKQRFGWSSSARVEYGVERIRGENGSLEEALRELAGIVYVAFDEKAGEIVIEYLPGKVRGDRIESIIGKAGYRITRAPDLRRTKRDLATDAERLELLTEPGARPPITDYVTLSKVLEAIQDYMKSFPKPMQRALEMWMEDDGFEVIAAEIGLGGADEARALVRAGQARLRERFRGEFPGLLGR